MEKHRWWKYINIGIDLSIIIGSKLEVQLAHLYFGENETYIRELLDLK